MREVAIDIHGKVITVKHGDDSRQRVTQFHHINMPDRYSTNHPHDQTHLPRAPTLNPYEWEVVDKAMEVLRNALNREDTPLDTFDDMVPQTDRLQPGHSLILSHAGVGDVTEVRAVREIKEDLFEVNQVNGAINIDSAVGLDDVDYIEIEFSWKRTRLERFSG